MCCSGVFAHEGCILNAEAGEFLAADRVFDGVVGKDTRNYPPDIQVDFEHLKLQIDMPKPESKSFTAVDLKIEKVRKYIRRSPFEFSV